MARLGAWGGRWAVALAVFAARVAAAIEPMPAEVRVLSSATPRPVTTITVRCDPQTVVEDQTVGARPAAPDQGPASMGDTFRDELRLLLRGMETPRPTAVEVSDDLVSTVRVQPEAVGTSVVIFVRQPVSYVVARPTAGGELVITLRPRAVQAAGTGARGGEPRVPEDGQISIDAADLDYDRDADVIVARGGVSITRGGATLRADEVRYDRRSGVADATGNVVLVDPNGTITGSAGQLDMNDESGWMNDAGADFPASGYNLQCRRVEKGIGPQYAIDEAAFTTCRCGGLEKPSWSLRGRRTDIKLNGIGTVRGATFRVKDVPVLWVPAVAFPALTDRGSGFLIPRFGYSQRRGVMYQQPYYWAISKSQDATIALDVETNARAGILGEYRYALSKQSRGTFAGGYWNESFRSASADDIRSSLGPTRPAPDNRWLVFTRARHALGERRELYFDVFSVSDDTLLREIRNFGSTLDTDLRLRSARLTKSRTGGIQTWQRGLWQAEADYFQDLIDPQDVAPQRAPDLRAEQAWPLLDNRLVARLGGQTVNFQRNEGFDGFRGDVNPELFYPFQLSRYLQGSLTGGVHATMYRLADDRQVALVVPTNEFIAPTYRAIGDGAVLSRLDPTYFRGVAVVRGQLGTEFTRAFNFPHFGVDRLRHSIMPELRYLFVPEVANNYDQQQLRSDEAPTAPVGVDCNRKPNRSTPECRRYRNQLEQFNTLNGRFVNATVYSRGYLFDELDAINRRNFISYGVSTRLLGRIGGGVTTTAEPVVDDDDDAGDDLDDGPPSRGTPALATRELLRFSIRHGIDPTRTINGPPPGGSFQNRHLANLDLGLRANPLTYLALSYGASLNVARGALAAQNAALSLVEPNWVPGVTGSRFQSPYALTLGYRFVEQNVNQGATPVIGTQFNNAGVRNLVGSAYLRLGNRAGFAFGSLYDFNDGLVFDNDQKKSRPVGAHFILRQYLLRYISPCDCWAAEFGVTDNFQTDERLFRFQLTPSGLGSFRHAGQGVNYTGISTLPRATGPRPTGGGALGGGVF
jgi:LPS-assembly protein